jgi:tetratricopeptide (TPR) repeat protein
MKTRAAVGGLVVLFGFLAVFSAVAQTAKPAAASRQPASDAAARQQLAAYMEGFRRHPEDAELRDRIIHLAKTLKPAPAIPPAAKADFARAAAALRAAATADELENAGKLFEQVAVQAPWYADAYGNAASAYAKAAEYGSARRNLTLYLAAVRAGADTPAAAHLQREIDHQLDLQFPPAMNEFRSDPSESNRERVIQLALALARPPAISDEAHEAAGRAAYASQSATSEADRLTAAEAYAQASLLAPWAPQYYFQQGLALEKARQYDRAIEAFGWYLAAAPNARDAGEVRERIGGLRFAREKAAQEQQDAEARSRAKQARIDQAESRRRGCFALDESAASLGRSVHYNWAQNNDSATLQNNLVNRLAALFQCATRTDEQVANAYADLSLVIARHMANSPCFQGDEGSTSQSRSDHQDYALASGRRVALATAQWKTSIAIQCMARARQVSFYADMSVALAQGGED